MKSDGDARATSQFSKSKVPHRQMNICHYNSPRGGELLLSHERTHIKMMFGTKNRH